MNVIKIMLFPLLLILVAGLGYPPCAISKTPVGLDKMSDKAEQPSAKEIPGSVKKSFKPGKEPSPNLKIQKVYLEGDTLHVVLRNTGKGKINPRDYAKAKLYVSYRGLMRPWSWKLREVDSKRTYFRSDVDFDTGETIKKRRSIEAWVTGIPSDEKWQGMLQPRIAVAPKPSPASPKPPPPSMDRSSALGSGGERVTSDSMDGSASGRIAGTADRDQTMSQLRGQGIGTLDGQGAISSVSPQPVEVGADLTITGSEFGEETGTVKIAFRESTYIDCRVRSWHSDRIVITIPEFVEATVGEGTTSARVRVIASGREYGPSILADINPNEARLTPIIESVSARHLHPGETVYINGRNFLSQGPQSRVDFRFFDPSTGDPSITHTGTIVNWDDTTIAVRMIRDLTGFNLDADPLSFPFEIEMRNNAGNVTTVPECSLEPILIRKIIEDVQTRSNSGRSCDSTASGTEITSFRGRRLKNGWKVVGVPAPVSEILSCNCARSCYIDSADYPTEGSSNPETSAWVFFKKQVIVKTEIVIEGPQGLPYE